MAPEQTGRSSALQRWVPGLRMVRTYDRGWLRFDLIAGVVLAAILVPQGMAYAELAGLPPVTGLYTTIACLVGYAIFGPSRVLVLGPDSSVSPLIFAAITPLIVAGDDPGKAIALAGMLAIMVGLIEIGLGLGKLGFVADLLSKEVQVGYMNGLAHHHHRRPAPEAVRLLHRRRRLRRRDPRVRHQPRPDRHDHARARRRRCSRCCSCSPGSPRRSRRCSSPSSAPRSSRRGSTWPPKGSTVTGAAAPGRADADDPVDERRRRRAAAHRRRRHHAGVADRHDRHRHQLRRPPRRRGRRQPGDGRHGRVEHRRRASSRASPSPPAARAPRWPSSPAPRARSPAWSAPAWSLLLLLVFNSLLADLPQTALAAVVIAAALSLMDLSVLRRYAQVRRAALVLSVIAPSGVVLFGVLQGILDRRRAVDPAVLPAQLVAPRRGARPGRRARRLAQHRALPRRRRRSTASSSTGGRRRCSSPTRASSSSRCATSSAEQPPALGRAPVRGGHRHRRHRGRHARAARPRAQRPGRAPGLRRAARPAPRPRVAATACDETLDRDHFYPSIEAALTDIAHVDSEPGPDDP